MAPKHLPVLPQPRTRTFEATRLQKSQKQQNLKLLMVKMIPKSVCMSEARATCSVCILYFLYTGDHSRQVKEDTKGPPAEEEGGTEATAILTSS